MRLMAPGRDLNCKNPPQGTYFPSFQKELEKTVLLFYRIGAGWQQKIILKKAIFQPNCIATNAPSPSLCLKVSIQSNCEF